MGKLVVFWSPWHGQAKVTANMSAVACLLSGDVNERLIMSHSQFGMADLEGMFNFRMGNERRKAIYESSGLSALITRVKQEFLSEELIESCLFPISAATGLYLLPGTEEHFDVLKASDTEALVFALLGRDIKEHYDWVFVDASAGNNELSMRFLEAADVVVVNLSQNLATWEKFMKEYSDIAKKKNVMYVIGGYDAQSRYNRKNLIRYYPNVLNEKNVGVVPYNTGLMDAITDGSVAKYIFSNEGANKNEENYDLISECRKVGTMIREIAVKGD